MKKGSQRQQECIAGSVAVAVVGVQRNICVDLQVATHTIEQCVVGAKCLVGVNSSMKLSIARRTNTSNNASLSRLCGICSPHSAVAHAGAHYCTD
jgi:hypothetical protein